MAAIAPAAQIDQRHRPAGGARTWRPFLALFLLFVGFYLLTASGHFYAVDEETLYLMTESLVERHTIAPPPGAWGVIGNGHYAQYTPGQALAAVPLYLVGRTIAPAFPHGAQGYVTRFFVSLLNAFVTAATVTLLYWLARRLGYRGGAALGLAAIYGLATLAWPHGRTFFAEPLTAFLLLLAFACTWRGAEPVTLAPSWLAGAGAALVAALVVKPQAAIAVPILALYVLGRLTWPERAAWRTASGRVLRGGLVWGVGMALVAVPFAIFNTRIYGGPLKTGYGGSITDLLGGDFFTGFTGLTISSGKGLLWYAPPIVLAIAGWWAFARRRLAEALVCLGMLAVHLAFYSRLIFWHGDGSWGPRYLTIALPFALLPAIAVLEGLHAHRVWLALVTLVVVLGLAVQLFGVLVNFDWYILRSDEQARHFTPAAAPILAHARTLDARVREWRLRLFPPADSVALTNGFSYAEGSTSNDIFPRWTTGDGVITLYPAASAPLLVKLTFFDNRPAALRTSQATVLVNNAPLPASAIERRDVTGNSEGWIYQFTVPASAFAHGPARVTLHSATWNPKSAGVDSRDETLGVFVHNVEVWRAGQPLAVRAALTIDPLPDTPRWRFWWFNDDAIRHHPADLWFTYAAEAGLPRGLTAAWIAGYGLSAAAIFAGGLALGWPLLPGSVRHPVRRKQRRKRGRAVGQSSSRAVGPGQHRA
ncbi:MAG: phospholipid carrier-dependent glycosyltransferase [Thermomicrobiales bacterium]